MATATKAADAKPGDKKEAKEKKPPKPMLQRLDEQVTRAVIGKKVTLDDMAKFTARIEKLKALLE